MILARTGAAGANGSDGVNFGELGTSGGPGESIEATLSGNLPSLFRLEGGRGGNAGRAYNGEYADYEVSSGTGGDASLTIREAELTDGRLNGTVIGGSRGGPDAVLVGSSGNANISVSGLMSSSASTVAIDFSATTPSVGLGSAGAAVISIDRLSISNASSLTIDLGAFAGSSFSSRSTSSASLANSSFIGTKGDDTYSFSLSASYDLYSVILGSMGSVSLHNNNFYLGSGNDNISIDMRTISTGKSSGLIVDNLFDGGDGVDVLYVTGSALQLEGFDPTPDVIMVGNTFRNFEFLDYSGKLSYIGNISAYMNLTSINNRNVYYDLSVDNKYHQVVASDFDISIKTGAAGSSIKLGSGSAVVNGGAGKDTITLGSGQALISGGEGGKNTFIIDRWNASKASSVDDLSIISDFHTTSGAWSASNDFIWLRGFSSSARIEYKGDVAGASDKHIYSVSDGAFHTDLILQYAGAGHALSSSQWGKLASSSPLEFY